MSWRSKTEAQIAFFRELEYHTGADTMQALLDVAVAADNAAPLIDDGYVGKQILDTTLNKLRELDT